MGESSLKKENIDYSKLAFRDIEPILILCRKCRCIGTRCQLYDDNPRSDALKTFKRCKVCGEEVTQISKEAYINAMADGYTYEPDLARAVGSARVKRSKELADEMFSSLSMFAAQKETE